MMEPKKNGMEIGTYLIAKYWNRQMNDGEKQEIGKEWYTKK